MFFYSHGIHVMFYVLQSSRVTYVMFYNIFSDVHLVYM